MCPIDGYILNECRRLTDSKDAKTLIISVKKNGGWSAIKDIKIYEQLIKVAINVAKDKGKTVAEWELETFNNLALAQSDDESAVKENQKTKKKPKAKSQTSNAFKQALGSRRLVNGYFYKKGPFLLFRGINDRFDYCEILVYPKADISSMLNEEYLARFDNKKHIALDFRYHRYTSETEEEKVQFFEKAKMDLDKIVKG